MRLIDADALKEKISYRQWNVDDDLPRDEASTRISECYVIDHMVDDMPTVDAIPLEYISRYQKTCDGDLAMALEDLKASWQIVGPTWKPKRKRKEE